MNSRVYRQDFIESYRSLQLPIFTFNQSPIKLQQSNTQMYSSSPQVIKHYVPMNFSKMTVDFKQSPKKLFTPIKPIEQSPLTNYKLKQLQDKPKDYVLIFKNKSVKEFMPRKKITLSPKVKKMRKNHQQGRSGEEDNNVINIENFEAEDNFVRSSYSSSKLDFMKLRQTAFENFTHREHTPERESKTSSTVRRNMNKAYDSARDSQRQTKSAIRNRKGSIDKYEHLFRQYQEKRTQNQGLKTLRISGSRAPNSQVIDHFKRYSLENNNTFLLNKLVR